MNPSIKKLISAFLLTAVVASSLAFGVSALVNRPDTITSATPDEIQGGYNAFGLASGSAFKTLPGGGPNGQNLTETVTDLFAQQLVETNPAGLVSQPDGLVGALFPDTRNLESYLKENAPSIKAFTPAVDDEKIKVIPIRDRSDVTQYLASVSKVGATLSSDPAWRHAITTPGRQTAARPAINWTSQGSKAITAATEELYRAQVPEPLLDFHRSLLALAGTMSSSLIIAKNDPMASVIAADDFKKAIETRSKELMRAADEAQAKLPEILASLPSDQSPSGITSLFGVKKAHAYGVPIDTSTDVNSIHQDVGIWEEIVNWLADHWQGILLGQLRVVLIQKLSEKVIELGKGKGGVWGYVANWVVYQADAQLAAKFNLISDYTAKICGNAATNGAYGQILASALDVDIDPNAYSSTEGDGVVCPPVVSAATYASNGKLDWDGYVNTLKNNTWNNLLTAKDQVTIAMAQASQAAVNEAISGRGSLDDKKCGDGSTIDPKTGKCADGSDPVTVTQGASKQDLVSKSLTSAFELITGASNQDFYESLANALTNMVITRVIEEGEGVFESDDDDNNPPPPASTFEGQLAQYRSILNRALADENQAKRNLASAINILRNSIPITCSEHPQTVTQAAELADTIDPLREPIDTKISTIQGLIDALEQVTTIEELQSRIGTLQDVTNLTSDATQDKNDTNDALTQANGLLQCT